MNNVLELTQFLHNQHQPPEKFVARKVTFSSVHSAHNSLSVFHIFSQNFHHFTVFVLVLVSSYHQLSRRAHSSSFIIPPCYRLFTTITTSVRTGELFSHFSRLHMSMGEERVRNMKMWTTLKKKNQIQKVKVWSIELFRFFHHFHSLFVSFVCLQAWALNDACSEQKVEKND